MTPFAALALYPLLAIAITVALTAFRLGRSLGTGLVALSASLSIWIVCLVALEHPDSAAVAQRYLPLGIMLSGPSLHAAADLIPLAKRYLYLAYGYGAGIAGLGMVFPNVYYRSNFAGPGPMLWPVTGLSTLGVLWAMRWMIRAASQTDGLMKRRRFALAIGTFFTAVGSGLATLGHIFGYTSLAWAAPPLLIAILLVSYSILSGQSDRRQLLSQDLAYTGMTAVLGAIGITVYIYLFPVLAPANTLFWLLFISFVAAMPLDQLRILGVEAMGRRLFKNPIGLADLTEEIAVTKTRADHVEGLAQIGVMASAVAHELRNPLGVIRAQAALLERRGADQKSVSRLREQVDRASNFIDDMLLYSRPRPLTIQTLRVSLRLQAAIDSVRLAHPDIDTVIDFTCINNDEIEADTDALLDSHIVILKNAIAAGCQSITVELAADKEYVVVSITDDGPGVPPELIDTFFDPFVTGRGRDTKYPGTGLGLAITQRWVERHGGDIRHERPERGGARFVLRWPRTVNVHG